MKKKIFTSSVLTIIICICIICGATFALFTSDSKVNITVETGNVDVMAYADKDTLKTSSENAETYVEAVLDGNTVNISKMLPGDTVEFDIVIDNRSDIPVLYQTIVSLSADSDLELFSELKITLDNMPFDSGFTAASAWTKLEEGADIQSVHVVITLPLDAVEGNGGSCRITYAVNAVQGNADIDTEIDENTTYIYTATDMLMFAKSVNEGNQYIDKTVKLMADIDLANIEWTTVNDFYGVFDGNNKKIENLSINSDDSYVGMFGKNNIFESFVKPEFRDLTIANADIVGNEFVAVLFASASDIVIDNVSIADSKVSGNKYLGGILAHSYGAGNPSVTNCTAENVVIDSQEGTAGVIVGMMAQGEIKNNVVKNCDVKGDEIVGLIAGQFNTGDAGPVDYENNTAQDSRINDTVSEELYGLIYWNSSIVEDPVYNEEADQYEISTAAQFASLMSGDYAGKSVVLTDDIDLFGAVWNTPVNVNGMTFDGQGYEIANAVIATRGQDGAGLFGGKLVKGVNIKNVVLDGITYEGKNTEGAGLVIGSMDGGILQDITVNNSKITGYKQVGIVAGYTQNVDIKDITVTNCEVIAVDDKAGAVIGQYRVNAKSVIAENVLSEGNKVTVNDDQAGGIIGGFDGNNGAKDQEGNFYTFTLVDCISTGNIISAATDSGAIAGKVYSAPSYGYTDSTVIVKLQNCSVGSNTTDGSSPLNTIISGKYWSMDPVIITPDNVQSIIDNAKENDIITLPAGKFGELMLKNADGTPKKHLTIRGSEGTVVDAIKLNASSFITIENIAFDAAGATEVYDVRANVNEVVGLSNITSTEAYNGAIAGVNNGAHDIIIKNCVFEGTPVTEPDQSDMPNAYSPIYFNEASRAGMRAYNITVEGCRFNVNALNYLRLNYIGKGDTVIRNNVFGGEGYTTNHHNINMTSNASNVILEGNDFNNWSMGEAAFGTSKAAEATIVVKGNTFTNTFNPTGNVFFGYILSLKSYKGYESLVTVEGNYYKGAIEATDETAATFR